MYRLYQFPGSGNCYKVELMLNLLGEDYETVTIDLLKGESQTPEYFAKNPNGKTPTLQLPDGTYLPESNAILYYLAEGTAFFPSARLDRAQVLQWMFFEQYSHEPYIATARYWVHIRKEPDHELARLEERHAQGHRALGVMDQHLTGREVPRRRCLHHCRSLVVCLLPMSRIKRLSM